jgi:hypothetical protein
MPRRLANLVMLTSWTIAGLVIWGFWGVPEHQAGPYVAIAGVILFMGFAVRNIPGG